MHSLETLCSSTSLVDFHYRIPALTCIASTSKTVLRSLTQKAERLQVLIMSLPLSRMSRRPAVFFDPSTRSQHAPAALLMRELYILTYAADVS